MSAPQRLRILHVTETHGGGVETTLRHFTAQQVHAGHAVALLAPQAMGPMPGVARRPWPADRRRPWSALPALAVLRRAALEHRADVVHLHSFVAGLIGRLPATGRVGADVPVVYQPHSWSFDVFGRRSAAAGMRAWERWAARRTDVLLPICTDELREGCAAGVHAAAQVLGGVPVDLAAFHPVGADQRAQARRDLGLGDDHVVVCVGRLARQKGQDLLVRAWEEHRPAGARLVLVGPGDPAGLPALAPTQWGRSVVAVGGQTDVRPWLWAGDLVVLPSRYESLGFVVAEAMACGVPVVATAVNGVREALVDGPLPPAGAVVDVGDMESLLHQVEKRLEDPALRHSEALAGRSRAERQFSPEHLAARLEGAYRDAMAARARKALT